jgi:thiol-disulfide isomerase/thioredoxin
MRIVPDLVLVIIAIVIVAGLPVSAQLAEQRPVPRTTFFDSDGNQITNNEFVDIRMANFHLPDRTLMKTFEDGRVEFRLQKVPQEGMPLPDLKVQTLDGRTITSADLKGKVAVLNFWFIGCPVCLSIKPNLNQLAAKFAGRSDVIFLALTGERARDVKKFLSKEEFNYVHASEALPSMELFGFVGYPKNIVVSRTGEVVYWRSSVKAWDKFESVINTELNK